MHQGEELKKLRKKRKVKLSVIASHLGIKENSVYFIEMRESIKFDTLKKYCEAIDLPISYFYPDLQEPKNDIKEISGEYEAKPHLGNKIRELRIKRNINVSEFAAALGYKNRQSVYSMEKRADIDIHLVKKVAEVLKVPVESLLGHELLDTFIKSHPEEDHNKELQEKDKKIMSLQDKVIELQEEVNRLNKLLNIRKSD